MRDSGASNGTDGQGGGGGGNRVMGQTSGGNGKVIIRFANNLSGSVSPGSNSIANSGNDRIATFNVSGNLALS